MARNTDFNPYEMMSTKSGAQSYLTGMMDEDYTRIDHIRDYLRFSLSVVTDEDGEFLVWVKSGKHSVEERHYFDRYAGDKIELTKGSVTNENCHIFRRLVFTWLDRKNQLAQPRRLHEYVFVHSSRSERRAVTDRNRIARKKTLDSKKPQWWMGGGFKPEAVQLTGVPRTHLVPSPKPVEVEEDGDSILHSALRDWNNALRTDKNLRIPQAISIFTTDMDHIVSNRYTHLIVRLLVDVYANEEFDAIKTFVSNVVGRTNYRQVYNTVQHLIPDEIKRYINRARSVLIHRA